MNRSIRGGIIVDNAVMITDEKKTRFPYYMRVLQLLAIIVGCYSSVSIWIEALGITVNQQTLTMVMIITSVIAFLYMVFPSYDLVKGILSALFYGLFFYSRLDRIINGFFVVENLVIDKIDAYYEYQSVHYIADMSNAQADATLLLSMILVPLTALYAVGVVRSKYISLCNIFLLIPVAVSFAIGLIPSERYLIAYLMITLYLSRSINHIHSVINKEQRTILQRINMKSALTLSLMGIILFFLMKSFVSEQEYNRITEIKTAKSEIQSFLFNFSLEDANKMLVKLNPFNKSNAVGGLNRGELGRVDQITYNNKEHLRIWAPSDSLAEGLYLKGYVGSNYNGNSWTEHSKEDRILYKGLLKQIPNDQFTAVNQVSTMLEHLSKISKINGINTIQTSVNKEGKYQFYQGQIKIAYVNADTKYLFSPYFTDFNLSKDEEYKADLYASPKEKKDKYTFDYYYGIAFGQNLTALSSKNSLSKLNKFAGYEKLYRDYVYQVYTKLPAKGLEQLKKDFAPYNPQIKGKSVEEKIAYVKEYLNANAQYSLSPGRLPKGKDFVEYFLYQNQKGYCTHFASAGVLMLRSMGIPARYVEGYAVGKSDIILNNNNKKQTVYRYSNQKAEEINIRQAQASIKDKNAHAWVEVYIDGCGFVPVEFTPGALPTNANTKIDDMTSVGDELDKNDRPKVSPTVTQKLDNKKKSEENLKPTKAADQKSNDKSGKTKYLFHFSLKDAKDILPMLFILCMMAALVVIAIWYVRIRKRNSNRITADNSKKALVLYKQIEKIFLVCNAFPGGCLDDYMDQIKELYSDDTQDHFTNCMEAVKKARFGRECISIKELQVVEGFRTFLYHSALQKLPVIKRIYLKLILSV